MNERVSFEVNVEQRAQGSKAERRIIALTGAIDMMTAPAMERVLFEAIDDGCVNLVADMAGVEFIDVVGLEALAGVASDVRAVGGHLSLRSPNDLTRRICRLIGLDPILPVEQDASEPALREWVDRARGGVSTYK
jgi:anti-sigma B factor antagonist